MQSVVLRDPSLLLTRQEIILFLFRHLPKIIRENALGTKEVDSFMFVFYTKAPLYCEIKSQKIILIKYSASWSGFSSIYV